MSIQVKKSDSFRVKLKLKPLTETKYFLASTSLPLKITLFLRSLKQ